MLSTSIILPHPALKEFVFNYSLCESDVSIQVMNMTWVAHHDTSICFYLADMPRQIPDDEHDHLGPDTNRITLYGLLTQCLGGMAFEGNYKTFLIEFKPNGFSRLFDIPAPEICNGVFSADDVIGTLVDRLHTRLINAKNIREMAGFADEFLFGFLNRRKAVYYNDGITRITNQLLANSSLNISQYAAEANMSMRNFERRFTEQVGTSPKLYCRLLRFNAAVLTKIAFPGKSWTDIAYECGYCEDLHLIKEFKQFAAASPVVFFENNPLLKYESFRTVERLPS